MTVFARDGFTYSAPASSGDAYFTTTDNEKGRCIAASKGSPTTGDAFAYTLTFPTGDLTIRARWTSTTTLIVERISTIPGTNTGTATLRTFTGTSTSKPRTAGDLVRLTITVNRGAVNGLTAITATWHGRAGGSLTSEQTTDTFNVDGELTPTAGAFAITGSSFYNRADLEGTTPDGDGDGSLAVGTYAQAEGWVYETDKAVSKADVVGVDSDGVCRPQEGAFDDCFYVLQGTGIPNDQYAKLIASIPEASDVILWIPLRCAFSSLVQPGGSDRSGLALIGITLSGQTIELDLYDLGTNSFIDGITVDTCDGTPHEYYAEAVGDDVVFKVDGVPVFSLNYPNSYSGDPGFGAVPSTNGDPGIDILGFEIGTPEGFADPCTYLMSRHEFYEPRRTDVDTQRTDEFPYMGTLYKHPASETAIGERGGDGYVVGSGRAVYLDRNIEGQVAGLPAELGPNYCARLAVQFPDRDVEPGTTPTRRMIWEDDLESLGLGEPLNGRVKDGGIAGVGTWTRVLKGDEDDGPEAVGDGEGRAMQLADPGAPRLSVNTAFYYIAGLTLPANYDVETDVYNASQLYGKFGTIVRWPSPFNASNNGYVWDVFQHQSVGPYRNSYHAGVGLQPTGALTTASVMGGPEVTKEFETRIRNLTIAGASRGYCSVFFGGVRDVADGVGEISFYDGQFGTPENLNDPGAVGVKWEEDGAGDVNPLRLAALRIYDYVTTPGTPAHELASAEVLVRYDPLTDSGYGLRLTFDHTDEDNPPVGTLTPFVREFGVERRLLPASTVGVLHDFTLSLGMRAFGTVLVFEYGGVAFATFDYATEMADEDGDPVTAYDTGDPGFGGTDGSDAGQWMNLQEFRVYNPGDEDGNPIDPPCDDGGGGGGGGYPPGPPTPLDTLGLWVKENGLYRFVQLPSPTDPTTRFFPKANFLRRPTQVVKVKANLAYRALVVDPYGGGDAEYYPPGAPEPNYDLCEQLPPLPVPPDVPVGVPPERLFFAWAIAATQLGPLWTATFRSMGSSIRTDISQAAARGGCIIGTPGDKNKFMRNGTYADDLMDSWIAGLAGIPGFVTFILDAQDNGSFGGLHAADDWENPAIWPRYGLPLPEINRIAGVWKSYFNDGSRVIRVMLRARTGQIGGVSLPNIDGVISQMRMTGKEWEDAGRSAARYAEIELDYCQNRGWLLHLSQNFYQGTSVRDAMTPEQIFENAMEWCDVVESHPWGGKNVGQGGWKYEGAGSRGDVTTPPYNNVYAAWRNRLQTLGPPS